MFFHLALFFAVGFLAGPGGFYASPAEAPRPRTSMIWPCRQSRVSRVRRLGRPRLIQLRPSLSSHSGEDYGPSHKLSFYKYRRDLLPE